MTKRSRVLIADDDEVYRGGLRLTLETDTGIEIIGEAAVIDQVLPLTRSLQPDVLLLDLRWRNDEDAALRKIPQINKTSPATRVIAISAHDDLLLRAKSAGANAALPKEFPATVLLTTVRTVSDERSSRQVLPVEKQAHVFLRRLTTLVPGIQDAKRYEHLMEQLIPFFFADHLSNFKNQSRSRGGKEIPDLIAYIESNHPFWANLRDHYESEQIIFDMKNTKALKVGEVLKLARYLRRRTIHVGVIITRVQPSESTLSEAHKMFETGDDLVLFLTDDLIREMLRSKMQGNEPTDVLNHVYLELTRK